MSWDVVIVGAGLGGLRAAEFLRAQGFEGSIALVGAEHLLPYDRPPLSKDVLTKGSNPPLLTSHEALAGLDVEVHLGVEATHLDPDRHVLSTTQGQYSYRSMIIATGARARTIPTIGGQALRTWDDATTLRQQLAPGRRLVVLGAGLIGCEVASSALSLGVDVTLVDSASGPMTRVLGPVVADLIASLHRERGVALYMGRSVASASDSHLTLDDGTVLPADVLLQAIGAGPDLGWLQDSGVRLLDGIVCTSDGRTTLEDVYAIGDCARWGGHRHEHWTSAVEQARIVACTLTGSTLPTPTPSFWWSDQYETKLQGLGRPDESDEVVVVEVGPAKRPMAVFSRDGRVTACVGFSTPGAITKMRRAIASGADTETALSALPPAGDLITDLNPSRGDVSSSRA